MDVEEAEEVIEEEQDMVDIVDVHGADMVVIEDVDHGVVMVDMVDMAAIHIDLMRACTL